jgi:hypothetical protein
MEWIMSETQLTFEEMFRCLNEDGTFDGWIKFDNTLVKNVACIVSQSFSRDFVNNTLNFIPQCFCRINEVLKFLNGGILPYEFTEEDRKNFIEDCLYEYNAKCSSVKPWES